jgi:hypothetical protein
VPQHDTTMVKTVAKAIKDAIVAECRTDQTYGLDYEAAARAAIAAMREPTPAMLEVRWVGVTRRWHGMIDAALEEAFPPARKETNDAAT